MGRLLLGVLLLLGAISPSVGSASICQDLPRISSDFQSQDFETCQNVSEGKTYDFYAFSVCRDLNELAATGAKASDINSCLRTISDKRFNYKKLKVCKLTRGSASKVLNCIKSSAV